VGCKGGISTGLASNRDGLENERISHIGRGIDGEGEGGRLEWGES
jgi:hypothetical protein